MSQDRDPFERLQYFIDPEPDPVVMQAVIAQSRKKFANRSPSQNAGGLSSSLWIRRSVIWLLPASFAAFAGVLMIATYMLQPGLGTRTSPDVAEAPPPSVPRTTELSRGSSTSDDQASGDTSRRLGAQPVPNGGQTPIDVSPRAVSRFQGDGVVVGTRLDATGLEIYLPDLSGQQLIDVQGLMPGERVEVIDAFAMPDTDLVVIHFAVNDGRFWRVYHPVNGKYGRDPERSRQVSDAQDRAEAERRLGELGP